MIYYNIVKIGKNIMTIEDNSYIAAAGKTLKERLIQMKEQYNITGKQTVIYHNCNLPSLSNEKIEVNFDWFKKTII